MMHYERSTNRGLIKFLALLVIAVVILSYYRVDLRNILESELVKKNLGAVVDFVKGLWQNYLWPFLGLIWSKIQPFFVNLTNRS